MTQTQTLADRRTLLALFDTLAELAPTEDGRPGILLDLNRPDLPDEFASALLLDLLAAFGAIRLDRLTNSLEVPTVHGGYFLRLLRDLLATNSTLVADWSREGLSPLEHGGESWAAEAGPRRLLTHNGLLRHPFGRASDLLAVLELRRQELRADPQALRELDAAVGLVVRRESWGRRSYLLSRDSATGVWQLLGGRYEHRDGDLRQTLLRELGEELGCGRLTESVDVTLSTLGPRFAETRLSPTYGLLTRTNFQAFLVRFVTGLPPLHGDLRWVREDEMRRGLTDNGEVVDGVILRRLAGLPGVDLDALPLG